MCSRVCLKKCFKPSSQTFKGTLSLLGECFSAAARLCSSCFCCSKLYLNGTHFSLPGFKFKQRKIYETTGRRLISSFTRDYFQINSWKLQLVCPNFSSSVVLSVPQSAWISLSPFFLLLLLLLSSSSLSCSGRDTLNQIWGLCKSWIINMDGLWNTRQDTNTEPHTHSLTDQHTHTLSRADKCSIKS